MGAALWEAVDSLEPPFLGAHDDSPGSGPGAGHREGGLEGKWGGMRTDRSLPASGHLTPRVEWPPLPKSPAASLMADSSPEPCSETELTAQASSREQDPVRGMRLLRDRVRAGEWVKQGHVERRKERHSRSRISSRTTKGTRWNKTVWGGAQSTEAGSSTERGWIQSGSRVMELRRQSKFTNRVSS